MATKLVTEYNVGGAKSIELNVLTGQKLAVGWAAGSVERGGRRRALLADRGR